MIKHYALCVKNISQETPLYVLWPLFVNEVVSPLLKIENSQKVAMTAGIFETKNIFNGDSHFKMISQYVLVVHLYPHYVRSTVNDQEL